MGNHSFVIEEGLTVDLFRCLWVDITFRPISEVNFLCYFNPKKAIEIFTDQRA